MFLFGMRHTKYLVGAVFFLCISAFFVFNVQADVALFFSDTYVEQGVEIPDETGTTTRIQYEHSWTDFKGVVPDGAVVNSIFLHLTWSKVERTGEEEIQVQPEEVIVPETSTTSPDTEMQSDTPDTNDQSGGGGGGGESVETVETVTETNPPEPVVSETVEEIVGEGVPESENSEVPPTETEPTPTPVPENEPEAPEEEEEEESTPPSEDNASPSPTSGFEEVSLLKLFPLAQAEVEEPVTTDTTVSEDVTVSMSAQETDSEAVLTTESAPTSTDLASTEIVTEVPETHFFEILYSLDGTTWQTLKQVGFEEEKDLFVDLTPIGYEALANLRISIRYSIPSDYHEKIVIDSLRLELGYGEPLIVDVGGDIAYDERMPNFPMSAIISDVESENIRAVVLGRGGVFEFWYSVTEHDSGEVVWNKIQGGGPIDETAPIAIIERTIFWLDRNQQTLYGLAVDKGSISGVSFTDPEHKVFTLPFKNAKGKKWEAVFIAELNSLEFHEIKDKS